MSDNTKTIEADDTTTVANDTTTETSTETTSTETAGDTTETVTKPTSRSGGDDLLADADADDDEGGADEVKAAHPASWPEDWREKLAGEDDKWLRELKRFSSFENYAKSQKALRQKLSSGEYKRALPEDASDEEKAEWRKDHGIPDTPEAYDYSVDGVEWTDNDKPILESFAATLHQADAPQAVVSKALEWYGQFQQQVREQTHERDKADKAVVEDTLRAELGEEYRPSLSLMKRVLTDGRYMSTEAGEKLSAARAADGSRLLHDPAIAKFLIDVAYSKYGDSHVSGGEAAQLSTREEEIKKVMSEDINRYYKEGLDKELVEIRSKRSRAA